MFLTEFGLCAPNGDERSIDSVECEFVMQEADEYLQSWTYWDSQFFNDSLHGDSQLSSLSLMMMVTIRKALLSKVTRCR